MNEKDMDMANAIYETMEKDMTQLYQRFLHRYMDYTKRTHLDRVESVVLSDIWESRFLTVVENSEHFKEQEGELKWNTT